MDDHHGHVHGGAGLARIGFVVRQTGGTVTRIVERVYRGELAEGKRGFWTGTVYARPSDAGLAYSKVRIPTELGPAPAWVIPADGDTARADHLLHELVAYLGPLDKSG